MKNGFLTCIAITGGAISFLLGGIDSLVHTLLIVQICDYVTGVLVAGVFHNSPKTKDGALESRAGFKGLVRKVLIWLLVIVANRIDIELATAYCRDAVLFAFIANEVLSLIENMGLMGLPIPSVITNAIELLKDKGELDQNEL